MSKRLKPPNWDVSTFMSRPGSIEELPKPHVLLHPRPDGKPRRVGVKIYSWSGYAPGAAHIYVSFEAEKNYVWDGREGCWVSFHSEQIDGKDLSPMKRFSHHRSAIRWMRKYLKENFDGWQVTIDDSTRDIDRRSYVYRRDGD